MLAVIVIVGAALGALLLLRARSVAHRPGVPVPVPPSSMPPDAPADERADDGSQVLQIIRALPGLVVHLGPGGTVEFASGEAAQLGLLRRGSLAFGEIGALAHESAVRGEVVVGELSLRRPPLRKGYLELRVRAIPFSDGGVLLLLEDLTEENRVATTRRDFIANVSHELKTPVGAISLLAEALMSASDDEAAVQQFAQRMHAEAERLSNLINDVIDLSRLQGEDPLAEAELVAVDGVVHEAAEFVRAAAEARQITIVVGGATGLTVMGMTDQLVAAIRNLLINAIAYSPEHTQVAIAVRQRDGVVEIAVKDQGIGIDEAEQSRIFERFYRVDAARSRLTGGTGLGLAIVRNVCRNHGGDVTVWSVRDEGSTFTIQLPAADIEPAGRPAHSGAYPRQSRRIAG